MIELETSKIKQIIAGILLLVLFVLTFACSRERWMGTVDAVFKYNTEERSTTIVDVPPSSNAMRAGLMTGDRLLTVDGQDISAASIGEVKSALNGPVGSFAVLAIQRGTETMEFSIERNREKEKRELETDPEGSD